MCLAYLWQMDVALSFVSLLAVWFSQCCCAHCLNQIGCFGRSSETAREEPEHVTTRSYYTFGCKGCVFAKMARHPGGLVLPGSLGPPSSRFG